MEKKLLTITKREIEKIEKCKSRYSTTQMRHLPYCVYWTCLLKLIKDKFTT